ncbi:MAG: ActS/PrrB/RegB family redox-sensitive histidine kinase [Pseudomonadota bacterium]
MQTLAASDFSLISTNQVSVRLATFVRLRWIAVAGQLLTVCYVYFGLGFVLPIAYLLAAISMSVVLNVALTILFPSRMRLGAASATALLAYDILQLMALLYLTGGVENPFAMLIMVPVIVSAATLPLRNTVFLAVMASAAVAVLIYNYLPLPWFVGFRFQLPFIYKLALAAAISASMVFLSLYAWRLAEESRQMSTALAATELVLSREQKLHALDGLAAAAAHELGTPLSTIVLVTKELETEYAGNESLREDMQLLRSQAERCREILQKLTRAPDAQDPMHASLSVRELIDEASAPYRDQGVLFSVASKPSASVDDPETKSREPLGERQPGVVFGLGNLIENAVGYANERVDITAKWDDTAILLEIADDGPGFPADLMDSLGDPYVTTRGSGQARRDTQGQHEAEIQREAKAGGLGLGFFIAKTLLERSGASVELDNKEQPLSGAIVRITWARPDFEKKTARF